MVPMEKCGEASDSERKRPQGAPEPTLGYVAPMGAEVYTADGQCLGRVTATWPSYAFVESRPGAAEGYWVPTKAFAGSEDGKLILSVTRAEAERRGWTERPPAGPEYPQ
jgi:hypothetical protein